MKIILITVLALLAAVIAYPKESDLLRVIGFKQNLQVKQGLDLQGGAHLVFEADLSKTPEKERTKAMEALIEVIQKRANPAGTAEVNVQRQGQNRVIVELPGVRDTADAIDRIGRTARLEFLEVSPSSQQTSLLELTGDDIQAINIDFDPTSNRPVGRLEMKGGDATKKFADATTTINKTGSLLLITVDGQPAFGPATVSEPIVDGTAQLQGNFATVEEAKKTVELIRGGQLPVPVDLVEQRTVGPTLGQESIDRSLVAGIIGLSIVALFMLAYYRLSGVVAVLALMFYAALVLAIIKLSSLTDYTIVLTLAGTAGFILSIGMAVDANILIFERMKEELRAGKSLLAALEAGFDRAWTSIRDSNVSTLITCTILYIFGTAIIKGFAVTLALGVLVSMFTAVVVSRTLLRVVIRQKWASRLGLYGVKPQEIQS